MRFVIQRGCAVLLCVALLACGGGGDDNGGSTSIAADRGSVTVLAGVADAAPVAAVTITADQMPDAGLYISFDYSVNGLLAVTWSEASVTQARLDLQFKPPGLLAAGTYTDVITVSVCYDDQCRAHVRNSPMTLQVSYTVHAPPQGTAVASTDTANVVVTGYAGSVTAPVASFTVTSSEAISPSFWLGVSPSGSIVQGVAVVPLSSTQSRVDLTLMSAQQLAAGQYNDSVTVTACYDSSCALRLQGSPLMVTLQYTVSNQPQPEPGVTPLSVVSRQALAHDVIDAEYSAALDAVVMVSSWPTNALYVYRLGTQSEQQVALPLAPTSVSVSPDGLAAAAGHDARITHVDLRTVGTTNQTRLLNVSARVYDLVLAGNGYVHAFPAVDQWVSVHSVEIATNVESVPSSLLYAGAHARLHPSGTALYTADNGLSPGDIYKYDVSAGVSAYLYDSPYHGDYGMCGDLWFKDDGSQIYTACGNTFRSSSVRAQDMMYAGALPLTSTSTYGMRIVSLSQSSAVKEVALVAQTWFECTLGSDPFACRSQVLLYESDFLGLTARYGLAPVTVAGTAYAQRGLHVFHRPGALGKVLISRLYGMPNAAAEYQLSTFD